MAKRQLLPGCTKNAALLHQKSYPTLRSTGSQEILVALPAGELARVIVRGSLLLATAPQRFASRWVRFLVEQCTILLTTRAISGAAWAGGLAVAGMTRAR